MSTVLEQDISTVNRDFLPLSGVDFLEFYVGNARQAAYFYRRAMGMRWIAYAGPETGCKNRTSFVLQQGKIRFILTSPLRPDMEMAAHIHRHGDDVRDIALTVDDARSAWKESTRRGARSVREPSEAVDEWGAVKMASIAACGDTIHTFVERRRYHGPFLPGYYGVPEDPLARPTGLTHIDHISASVSWNERNRWIEFYAGVLGFSADSQRRVRPRRAALAKTMADGRDRLRFLIDEPSDEVERPGVSAYLESHHGPGIRHIALATEDILYSVSRMREQGVEFLPTADAVCGGMGGRANRIGSSSPEFKSLGIAPECDPEDSSLCAFTRPVEDRPTLCFEVVQRRSERRRS